MGQLDGLVLEDRLGSAQRDETRDAVVDVGLDLGLLPFRRGDHDPVARRHELALAGQHPVAPVGLQPVEELEPLVLAAHAAQPVAAIGDRHLRHDAAHPIVDGTEQHGVAATRAAGAERADAARVDVLARRQVRHCVDEILELQGRQQQPAITVGITEAAVVEDQHGEPGGGEGLVVADVQLGVLQPQPARSLHDRRTGSGTRVVGGAQDPTDPRAFAEELDGLLVHGVRPPPGRSSVATPVPGSTAAASASARWLVPPPRRRRARWG